MARPSRGLGAAPGIYGTVVRFRSVHFPPFSRATTVDNNENVLKPTLFKISTEQNRLPRYYLFYHSALKEWFFGESLPAGKRISYCTCSKGDAKSPETADWDLSKVQER